MFNYKQTLQAMRTARDSMKAELEKLTRAISALEAVVDKAAPAKTKRRLSIKKAKKGASANEKRIGTKSKISAQGLRNIVAAQKRPWAKVRAPGKMKVKAAATK